MKRHIFLTRRDVPLPGWREAFPTAEIHRHEDIGTRLAMPGAAILWLHIDNHVMEPATHVENLRKSNPDCPVVVLSNIPRDEEGLAVLAVGAAGYTNALAVADVLRQIESVITYGGLWIGPNLMRRLLLSLNARTLRQDATACLEQLSPREREVALAVATGATNKEVAQRLDITERTVKAHLGRVFAILNIRDRLQLAVYLNGSPIYRR